MDRQTEKPAIVIQVYGKSVTAVMAASEQELMGVRGLGKKKAYKIRETLTLALP